METIDTEYTDFLSTEQKATLMDVFADAIDVFEDWTARTTVEDIVRTVYNNLLDDHYDGGDHADRLWSIMDLGLELGFFTEDERVALDEFIEMVGSLVEFPPVEGDGA